MGLFNYVCGSFNCARCGTVSDDCIQTKLFQTDERHSSFEYREGDVVCIDGLADYCVIHPWDGKGALACIVGDWTCNGCGLHWQWARIDFSSTNAVPDCQGIRSRIEQIEGFAPLSADKFSTVNFVDSDFVISLALGSVPPTDAIKQFHQLPVTERIDLLVAGYAKWLEEVRESGYH